MPAAFRPALLGALFGLLVSILSACGSADGTGADSLSKDRILYQANQALSRKDCTEAIRLVDPLFNSAKTDNDVRMVRASAYACAGNVNFFKNLTDYVSNISSVTPSGFWGKFLAKIYPYEGLADRIEGSGAAQDTLLTVIKPGAVVPTNYLFDVGSYNQGSVIAADRDTDANVYLFWVSAASAGSILSRYGIPDVNYAQTTNLPWTAATSVDEDGCQLGASMLNLFDAADAISEEFSGSFQTLLKAVVSLRSGLDTACTASCGTVGCSALLKNRSSCDAGVAGDDEACAAAAIATFINTAW